jgi:trehalose 6-phosphate synthase/phosphatase
VKKIQAELAVRKLTEKTQKKLITSYRQCDNSIIMLDYDGTLVPFAERPQKAKPDQGLLDTLDSLCKDQKNEVVLISGRDKDTLARWFGGRGLNLIAEHGVWIKDQGTDWQTVEPLRDDWKEQMRPVLEWYEDRTPGSFIEEKDFSLVWHYRKADTELASIRARELKDELLQLTANLNLGILEGSKVIEIKSVGIDKGRAALHWLSRNEWDFILAIGDDWTDEDVFAVLPESAYSIKVGVSPSKAKFNLDSVQEVRALIHKLAKG